MLTCTHNGLSLKQQPLLILVLLLSSPLTATGCKIVVLIADNHASKLAFKLSRALLQPRDELQLVTVVVGEESLNYGSDLLAPYLTEQQQQQNGPTLTPVVRAMCIWQMLQSCHMTSM